MHCQTGGLGISLKALRVRTPEVNLQSLPKSAQHSRPSERLVLYCARHDYGTRVLMRTGNLAAVNENDGAPTCEDNDVLSAPGAGNRARCARLPSANLRS